MYTYGLLFDMPDASTTLTNIGAWSKPIFSDFQPIIYALLGIVAIGAIIGLIVKLLK